MQVEMKSGSWHEISLGYVEVPDSMVRYSNMLLDKKLFGEYGYREILTDDKTGKLRNGKLERINKGFQGRFGKGIKIKNVMIGLFDYLMEERGYVFRRDKYVLKGKTEEEIEFKPQEAQFTD